MKIINIFAFINLLPLLCSGQQIVWQNHFGGEGSQIFISGIPLNSEIIQDTNGDFILAVNTMANSGDQLALKADQDGNLIWQFNVGALYEGDGAYTLIKTFDGNYFMAGEANMQSTYQNHIRLTKFTDEGDTIFSKAVLGNNIYTAVVYDLCYTTDSNYIAACASYHNIMLVKFNENGDTLWTSRVLPDTLGNGIPLCFQPAPDFSAYYGVSVHNSYEYYWFKTDTAGQLINYKRIEYSGQDWVEVSKAEILPNGNILVLGGNDSSPTLCNGRYDFLYEYNSEGEVIKQKLFCEPEQETDPPYNTDFYEFLVTDDSSIYFLAYNILYKLNADWEFQWMDTLDLPYEISLFKLAQFEYGYLIGAGKIHLAPEDDDIFMCKIALPEAIGIQEPAGNDQVNLYPNPVTNTLTIETALPGRIAYSIYDVTGQIMQTGNLLQKKEIDMGAFADGVYVIQLQTEFGEVRKKFVKQ